MFWFSLFRGQKRMLMHSLTSVRLTTLSSWPASKVSSLWADHAWCCYGQVLRLCVMLLWTDPVACDVTMDKFCCMWCHYGQIPSCLMLRWTNPIGCDVAIDRSCHTWCHYGQIPSCVMSLWAGPVMHDVAVDKSCHVWCPIVHDVTMDKSCCVWCHYGQVLSCMMSLWTDSVTHDEQVNHDDVLVEYLPTNCWAARSTSQNIGSVLQLLLAPCWGLHRKSEEVPLTDSLLYKLEKILPI